MAKYDVLKIRKDFPALELKVNGYPACFFDGPGGTQMPQQVISAMNYYLTRQNSNTPGNFITSKETREVIQAARQGMADFLGAQAHEIAFGENATTLLFKLAFALAKDLDADDEVIITRLDHEANRGPWQKVLGAKGVQIKEVAVNLADVTLDMEDYYQKINEKVKLVCVTAASNAVGAKTDLKAIVSKAKEVGALVVVDAVHYAMHDLIDVVNINCDFLVVSGYKILGPHLGVLYGQEDSFERLQPFSLRAQKNEIPAKIETGTLNHEGIKGLLAAVDYFAQLGYSLGDTNLEMHRRGKIIQGMQGIKEYEKPLLKFLYEELQQREQVTIYGPNLDQPRTATVAFTLEGVYPQDAAKFLGDRGHFVWNGHFYAKCVVEDLGLEEKGGLIRIGLAPYNTLTEVQSFIATIDELLKSN